MCHDAELRSLDDYATRFLADMREKVGEWGNTMFFSERQEHYLMTVASEGLRHYYRSMRGRAAQ